MEATNSRYGKYPVKIYTIDGVLIYQIDNGGSNKDKQPVGGIITTSTLATSMMETIKNPNIFYGNWSAVVNQAGHTRALWDYYWTSCSRGSDGNNIIKSYHNSYLDAYTTQRLKSIYDPCPYGFRVPSNGSYNEFKVNNSWISYSYTGGNIWNINSVNSWIQGLGWRAGLSNQFIFTGFELYYRTSTLVTQTTAYTLWFTHSKTIGFNRNDRPHYDGHAVRCIEKLLS